MRPKGGDGGLMEKLGGGMDERGDGEGGAASGARRGREELEFGGGRSWPQGRGDGGECAVVEELREEKVLRACGIGGRRGRKKREREEEKERKKGEGQGPRKREKGPNR